jgi:hypothetical protein
MTHMEMIKKQHLAIRLYDEVVQALLRRLPDDFHLTDEDRGALIKLAQAEQLVREVERA